MNIAVKELEQALEEGAAAKRLGELMDARPFPHVYKDQAIDLALERIGAAQLDSCPLLAAPTYTSSKAS